jgi:hypothetical protein
MKSEEMTLHVPHAVTFTFILTSINLFSGFEHRLSLTNDGHLGAEKYLPFWCRHIHFGVRGKCSRQVVTK